MKTAPLPIAHIYMSTKEQILREEMRSLADRLVATYQWGVTVLISTETAIFFLRKDIYERMLANGQLTKNEYIPWDRYLIGTGVLLVLALIFFGLTRIIRERYKFYLKVLQDKHTIPDALPTPPLPGLARLFGMVLFFVFPLMEIAIRITLKLQLELH